MPDFLKETQFAQYKALKEEGCKAYIIGKAYDAENLNQITLVEMYSDEQAIDFHKTTPHFLQWRQNVEEFMNSPRQVTKLISL
jgi:autoinducer 2-degrading protein